LTGKLMAPEVRVLTPSQWVAERTADAEELLWRKSCKQCHVLEVNEGNSLPRVAPAHVTERWLPHARFDHDAHRGFSCAGCHPKALTSTESKDVLVPGIANCKTCHVPGAEHAESRCFECHTYHDWSKRKEVRPQFLMPGLQTGGR
jgi:transcription elongation factor Elf1